MLPEWKYDQIAKVKTFINKLLRVLTLRRQTIDLLGSRQDIFIQLSMAIDDAVKFFNLTKKEFFENINSWAETEEKLFNTSVNLKEFYESWNDQASVENSCANIFNQLIWFDNYNVCAKYAVNSNVTIDYGCGTAALSIGLALQGKIKNKLILLDVPNDIEKFRQFRINEHQLLNVVTENIFTFKTVGEADLIICLDVLEHLEESSDVFINKMNPMLKVGGHMILRAPWRGQLTHIDQAVDDFYLNGGRAFLSKNYKEVFRFGGRDICAVYQKIK